MANHFMKNMGGKNFLGTILPYDAFTSDLQKIDTAGMYRRHQIIQEASDSQTQQIVFRDNITEAGIPGVRIGFSSVAPLSDLQIDELNYLTPTGKQLLKNISNYHQHL